ncbi:MAG TPA: guanylate kinase [Thermoanaerobaculaceae bacterium]|nr:guanylate kinase [Thermoanaerobaculaceae bacterium]
MATRRGEVFIVASPSGGGKTTLIHRVMAELQAAGREVHFSVSHTTRSPRPGERDGVDYHFVDRPAFERMIAAREFLEYAEVHNNLYGTSRGEVAGRLERGCDVFLDIDVQGARQVRASIPDAVKVFVFPPSYAELRRRLVARRQDDEAAIALRIRNAVKEMREYAEFDYVIINDRLEEATRQLGSVVATSRMRPLRMRDEAQAIVEEFERAVKEE